MLLNLYLGCTTDWKSIPFGCLLKLLVQGHLCPSVFCGVSSLSARIAEGPGACVNQESSEVDAVGDRLSGDTTTVDVETFLRLF